MTEASKKFQLEMSPSMSEFTSLQALEDGTSCKLSAYQLLAIGVFPAHAGMTRCAHYGQVAPPGVPRPRGDDPHYRYASLEHIYKDVDILVDEADLLLARG